MSDCFRYRRICRWLTTVVLLAGVGGLVYVVADAQSVTVYWDDLHQEIDGFGASSADFVKALTQRQVDFVFGRDGIGLSILRTYSDRGRPGAHLSSNWDEALNHGYLRVVSVSVLTVVVASLSWRFFESPLLRLKEKLFPSQSPAADLAALGRKPAQSDSSEAAYSGIR